MPCLPLRDQYPEYFEGDRLVEDIESMIGRVKEGEKAIEELQTTLDQKNLQSELLIAEKANLLTAHDQIQTLLE